MKKILIIAYHYPPDSEVGGLRPAKITKYLPENDYEPYILTIKEKHIQSKEYSRMEDVKSAKIYRTTVWPYPMKILIGFKNIFLKPIKKEDKHFEEESEKNDNNNFKQNKTSFFNRMLTSMFELPDRMIGWLIPAIWKGYKLIKNEGIDIVLATAPPPTSCLIGIILSKLTGLKLITDLRDPFWLHDGKPEDIRTKFSDIVEKWIEKKIICNSNLIITTNNRYTEYLKSVYKEDLNKELQKLFVTIWNGYDKDDFISIKDDKKTKNIFTINYLGRFYSAPSPGVKGQSPEEFLLALSKAIKEGCINKKDIEINFIGDIKYANGELIDDFIKNLELDKCVKILGKVPYQECLRRMSEAYVLLLFAPPYLSKIIPSKTFEYLNTNRYILCLAADGPTSEFLQEFKTSIIVDPYDISGIKDAIISLYNKWKAGIQIERDESIDLYDRKALTKRMVEYIKNIV